MVQDQKLRSAARNIKLKAVRWLLSGALKISSPFDFMNAVHERTRHPDVRGYMARGGADSVLDNLYDLARDDPALRDYMANGGGVDRMLGKLYDLAIEDAALREKIVRSEVGDIFRKLYSIAVTDEGLRDYMTERGIEDLYRYAYSMAAKAGLPLAHRSKSFSQEGEDLVLTRFFDHQEKGFYVDVGAHHPFRFSNTYLLYLRGWRGINIDAMPGAMNAFEEWRSEDVNLECVVSNDTKPRRFFLYDEPALNTISEEVVKQREIEAPQYHVTGSVVLPARRLGDILAEYLPPGQTIDLFNIDVEGHDLDVLQSNDWERFRPRVVVVELIAVGFAEMQDTDLYRFLAAQGYRMQSKLVNTAIFTL